MCCRIKRAMRRIHFCLLKDISLLKISAHLQLCMKWLQLAFTWNQLWQGDISSRHKPTALTANTIKVKQKGRNIHFKNCLLQLCNHCKLLWDVCHAWLERQQQKHWHQAEKWRKESMLHQNGSFLSILTISPSKCDICCHHKVPQLTGQSCVQWKTRGRAIQQKWGLWAKTE